MEYVSYPAPGRDNDGVPRWTVRSGDCLSRGLSFDYAMVRRLSAPPPPPVPELKLSGVVDLGVYDRLLVGGAR